MSDSVHAIIRDAEENYKTGNTNLGKYVQWSMYDTIEKETAYINSKHISGDTDSLGRKKPFFNIVTAAVNIWYRATDIDRKDIVVLPNSSATTVASFMANVFLHEWMKKARFGVFLNEWGRVLAKHGSAVVEFVEKDGILIASVIPWDKLIVDPVDFTALPVIKRLFKTLPQLKNMATKGHPDFANYDMEQVKALETAMQTRETTSGDKVDNQAKFIEIYEVHGEMPIAFLKEKPKDDDWTTFTQQVQIVTFFEAKDKGQYNDFTLYRGKEAKPIHMLTHLIKEEGRTKAIGAVEYLFDAQWMQNHTIKQMKDQLDITSKIIFQTADPRFADKNVITNFESGDIFTWDREKGGELTQVNNQGHDITSLKLFSEQWKEVEREVTSTPDAARGTIPPSGTPLGTTQIVTAQGLSLFEVMTENKGLHIEDMLREYIIPHLKKKMKNKDELASILEDHEVDKIDAMYVPKEAIRRFNKRTLDSILEGEMPQPFNQVGEEDAVRQDLAPLGNQRFFTPDELNWDKVFKNLEWKLDVAVTNEQGDKQAVLATLSAVLQTIAANPQVLQDPTAKMLFNKILSRTGTISPIELKATRIAQPQPIPQEALKGLTQPTQ